MSAVLPVSTFPGLAALPIHWGLDRGMFAAAGVDVALEFAQGSGPQLARLSQGEIRIAHTSADNVFGPNAPEDAVLAAEWEGGELVVVADPDRVAAGGPWAVDSPDSGFSLVLRGVLASRLGIAEPELLQVGNSAARLEAIARHDAVGTIVQPGHEISALAAGLEPIAVQGDLGVEIMTVGVMVRRAHLADPTVGAYLEVWEAAADAFAAASDAERAECAASAGLGSMLPLDELVRIRAATGFTAHRPPRLAALEGLVELRQRFLPGWSPLRAALRDYLAG